MTADVPKPLLPPLVEVTVIVLQVLRRKLEFLDAINFDKSEVELARGKRTLLNLLCWEGTAPSPLVRVSQLFPDCTGPPPPPRTSPRGSALSSSVQLPG